MNKEDEDAELENKALQKRKWKFFELGKLLIGQSSFRCRTLQIIVIRYRSLQLIRSIDKTNLQFMRYATIYVVSWW